MKSTGNDLVALQFINEQRTVQSAFYSKFITVTEQALYQQQQLSFPNFVWLSWSVKESAYKYFKRSDADLVFSPSKITIQNIELLRHETQSQFVANGWERGANDTFYSGVLNHQGDTLYFLSIITPQFIATVVNDGPDFKQVYWGVQQIPVTDSDSQSKAVRTFALNRIDEMLAANNLYFEKRNDCPILYSNGIETEVQVSFAHHGNFVAYSFLNEMPASQIKI